jgi:UPF0755 protein
MPRDNNQWDQNRRYPGQRGYGVRAHSPAEALEPDRAPEPPRGQGRFQQHPVARFLNNLITFLFVGLIGLTAIFFYVRSQFHEPGPLEYDTVITIQKGAGVWAIADNLERKRVIGDMWIFVASVIYHNATDKLKAGEYAFSKHSSVQSVLDTLIEGKAILYSVSVPEGLTSYQIVERLNNNEHLVGKIDQVPPEGSLMPDTYRVATGTTRADLLLRMHNDQEKFLDSIWDTRSSDLAIKTKQEAIILASIVEKETGGADERCKVAAVFHNRLMKKMRLQSDPTIIYGLSGGKGTLGRPILKTEIEQMTPYNTYKNGGLTPTPIANPGRAALEAVLQPAKIKDLYFVANGAGGHQFSETYEEHQKGVALLRQREATAKAEEAAKAQAEAKTEAAKPDETAKAESKPETKGDAKTDAAKTDTTKPKTDQAKQDKTSSTKSAARKPADKKTDTAAVPGVNVTGTTGNKNTSAPR